VKNVISKIMLMLLVLIGLLTQAFNILPAKAEPNKFASPSVATSFRAENILSQESPCSDPPSLLIQWWYNTSGNILFPPVVGKDWTIFIVSEPFYTLHAINPDGALKWKYEVEYKVYFTPIVGSDGTVYLCVEDPKGDNYLYAINDGILKWKIKVEFEFENEIVGREIAPGEIDCPPIIDEQGTIYFTATGKTVLSPKAIFAINNDGTIRYKIADHKIEEWEDGWKYGFDKFGDLIVSLGSSMLITARNGMAYITAVALKREYYYGAFLGEYSVIAAIGPDGKVKWVSELFKSGQREWRHVIEGKNAMYLVIFNYTPPSSDYDVYLQALDYDGKVMYEFRADEYWNKEFYSTYVTAEIMPVIDKDDTVYLIFSNPQYGDFSIIYATGSNGTLKWKCKLPFAISESLVEFFNCDQASRLYLVYSILFDPYYNSCLYVINPNGELSWEYKYQTTLEQKIRPPLISEDGVIYLFSRNMTYVHRSGEAVPTSITFDIIHILSPEGRLIQRLSVFNLTGIPAEVDAYLENPIMTQNGTILTVLSLSSSEALLSIIPEIPSTIILVAFMLNTVTATALWKNKRKPAKTGPT
jgi:outer membrane protein assembly factor BamB